MNYTFHPLSEEYPLMPDHELDRLVEGMERHGFDQRFPIVLFKGKVLDGRNRYLAACRAGVTPDVIEFEGTEEEAREFVKLANEDRRHLALDWLRQRRAERVKRTAERKAAGESTRQIAEQEGVSQRQVRLDLKAATEEGYSVDPPDGKVKGKDGKNRPARSKPAAEPKAEPAAGSTEYPYSVEPEEEATAQRCAVEPAEPAPPDVDEWGIPIQEHARAAFDAVPRFEEMIGHVEAARKLFDELANTPAGRFLHFYAQVHRGAKGKPDKVRHKGLEEALRQIRLCVPAHTVCPWQFAEAGHPDECSCCYGMNWTAALTDSADPMREKARKRFGVEG